MRLAYRKLILYSLLVLTIILIPATPQPQTQTTNTPTSGSSNLPKIPEHQNFWDLLPSIKTWLENLGKDTARWYPQLGYMQPVYAATNFTNGFEANNFDLWTDGGTTTWQIGTSSVPGAPWAPHAGTYMAYCDGTHDGDLISDNINLSSVTTSFVVDFWYMDDDIDPADTSDLYYYDGASYDLIADLNSATEDTWLHYQQTVTDSQYFKSNFRIDFKESAGSGEVLFVDDVLVTSSAGNPVSLSDSAKLTDTLPYKFVGKRLSEANNLIDQLFKGQPRTNADMLTVTDSILKNAGKPFTDVMNLLDSIQVGNMKPLSEFINLIDALTAQKGGGGQSNPVSLADALNLVDSLLKGSETTITEFLTLTDNVQLSNLKPLTATVTFIDVLGHAVLKPLPETLTLSDVLSVKFVGQRGLSDTLTLIDLLGRDIGKLLSGTVNVADALNFKFVGTRTLSEILSLSDSLVLATGKFPSDVLNLVDSLSSRFSGTRSLSDIITLVDTLTTQFTGTRQLSDILNLTDAVSMGKLLTANIADTLALTEFLSFRFVGARPLTDIVSLQDLLSRGHQNPRSITDALNLLDSILKNSGTAFTFTETLNLNDAEFYQFAGSRPLNDALNIIGLLTAQSSASQAYTRSLTDIQTLVNLLSAIFTTTSTDDPSGMILTSTGSTSSTTTVTKTTTTPFFGNLTTLINPPSYGVWPIALILSLGIFAITMQYGIPELYNKKRWLITLTPLILLFGLMTYVRLFSGLSDDAKWESTIAWGILLAPLVVSSLITIYLNVSKVSLEELRQENV